MPWVRSRLHEKCPLHDVEVRSSGGKWFAHAVPCMSGKLNATDKEMEFVCEYLSQHYTGRYNTSIQCKYKGEKKEC